MSSPPPPSGPSRRPAETPPGRRSGNLKRPALPPAANAKPEPATPPDGTIPTEELVAYLDGELPGRAAQAVEVQLSRDPKVRREADSLRRTWELLDHLPRQEPSRQFTSRTVERMSVLTAARTQYAWTGPRVVAWAAMLLLVFGTGYAGTHYAKKWRADAAAELPLTDLSLLENLPYYWYADDIEFLGKLGAPDLFGAAARGPAGTQLTSLLSSSDADRLARLRQRWARFRALPAARQEQLRRLHAELTGTAPPAQDRLRVVLEAYACWAERLPDDDRRRLADASDASQRLRVVRDLRQQEWVRTLPRALQQEYARAATDGRPALVQRWRDEERARRSALPRIEQSWKERVYAHLPEPFCQPGTRREMVYMVDVVLRPRLTTAEENRLDLAEQQALQDNGGAFLRTVAALAEAHPAKWPGRPGVTRFYELPKELRDELGKRKQLRPRWEKENQQWPDFALAVVAIAKELDLRVPEPLGPCHLRDFPPFYRQVIEQLPAAERTELNNLSGHWPEYPKKYMALTKKRYGHIPGVDLPGTPADWDKYRQPK